jgi:2-dehydro-3-deoxygluconokinase
MHKKVCCFGELLLRLSPDTNNNNWLYANTMPFYVGGAELNTATALSCWNIPVKYFTALPDNYLSKQMVQYISEKRIDTDAILFKGECLGIYYLPVGLELKNISVIYDRANSSFCGLEPGMIDWDELFRDCSWLHFSAISPALNANLAAVCLEAVQAATERGLTISVDLNYRSKLWKYGKDPVAVMPDLVKYCHVIMGNIWAVESLLGISSVIESSEGKTNAELVDAAFEMIAKMQTVYPLAKTIAFTFRLQNDYFAVLQHEKGVAVSRNFEINQVVDKVGSGDCFMGGLIYGLYNKLATKEIINFSAAAAIGKLQEAGDATSQSVDDVFKQIQL